MAAPEASSDLVRLPLTQLKPGDRAMIAFDRDHGEGSLTREPLTAEEREILRAMGLDEHCPFTVCRAGSGGPCIVRVDSSRLGLSPELARKVMTRPCDCPESGCRATPDSRHDDSRHG